MNSEVQLAERLKALAARVGELERLETPGRAVRGMAAAVPLLRMMPGVVGIWTGSTPGPAGQLVDATGNGLNLTRQNGLFGVDSGTLIPRLSFDLSVPRYWNRAYEAITSITGTEAHIIPKGLTLLAWLHITAVGAGTQTGIAKWNPTGDQRSYALFFNNSGNTLGQISSTGAAGGIKSVTGAAYVVGSWALYVYRFIPSTEVSIWVNGTKTTDSSSVPASIFDSTADFTIGASHGGGNALSGKGGVVALSVEAVPDNIIDNYFQATAPPFGVSV
jgi:hypothetical protein